MAEVAGVNGDWELADREADRNAGTEVPAQFLRRRPTPSFRTENVCSPVRQRSASTVADLSPVFPRRLAGQDVSRPALERFRPRRFDSRFVVFSGPFKADQELGDQARTLVLGQRESRAKHRLRVIGHAMTVALDRDTPTSDPEGTASVVRPKVGDSSAPATILSRSARIRACDAVQQHPPQRRPGSTSDATDGAVPHT